MSEPTPQGPAGFSDAAFVRLRDLARQDSQAGTPEGAGAPAFGRFALISELGRGGSSVVWRAWEGALNRFVALKILKGCNPVLRERFLLEARVTAGLSHPGILPVYEAGAHDGALFIAMPIVEGERLDRCGLSPLEAAAAVAEAARVIAAAHEAGVIHRDLKPSNLMRDASRVYVMDFGLAKILDSIDGISFHGDVLGTPAFMAPEQAFGVPVDERTDVYGLGATLYALVTGRTPYSGSTVPEFVEAFRAGLPPKPGAVRRELPPGLEAVILRAMSRDPDGRHESALDLAAELERVVRGDWKEVPAAPGTPDGAMRISTHAPPGPEPGPRLVGREPELLRLVEAGSSPTGKFVVVLGEEGVGKSGLLRETARALRSAVPPRSIRSGGSHEGSGSSLHALAGVLGAVSANSAASLLPRLARDFARTTESPVERENLSHLLLLSLGFPVPGARVRHLETGVHRAETKRAWETWLRARARSRPLTLILEDLDRADPGTTALLEHLALKLRDAPVSILASSRVPSCVPRGFDVLPLERLGKADAILLARATLGADVDPGMAEFLFRESRGNPAHLRELVHWLRREGHVAGEPAHLSSGAGNPPPDFAGLLAARFHALSAEERAVLKTGSVLGPAFRRTLLETTLDRPAGATLASLGQAGLLELPTAPGAQGELPIGFRDSRLRDVAYAFVPDHERRRLHEHAAAHLEQEAEAGGRRLHGLAAAQWEAAGRAVEASRAWMSAARRAEQEGSAEEALAAAREACRLGRHDAAMIEAAALVNLGRYDEILEASGRGNLHVEVRNAYLLAASRVHRRKDADLAALACAERVLEFPGTDDLRLHALGSRASALLTLGRDAEAAVTVAEARRLLDTLAQVLPWRLFAARSAGLRDIEGMAASRQGRWDEARVLIEDAVRLHRETGDRRQLAAVLNNQAGVLHFMGQFSEALAVFREVADTYRDIGDRHGLGLVHFNLSVAYVTNGFAKEAAAEAQRSMEVRHALGELSACAVSRTVLGRALRVLGQPEESRAHYAESLAVLRQFRPGTELINTLEGYAKTLDACGDAGGAAEARAEAGKIRRELGSRQGG